MKSLFVTLPIVFALAGTAAAAEFKLGATLDEVWVSGVRPYTADRNANSSTTDSRLAGGLSVRAGLGKWEIGANYRYISDLRGTGTAASSDIFNQGGVSTPGLTPYTMEEKIHQGSVSLGYQLLGLPVVSLTVGPDVSLFVSDANFRTTLGSTSRSFSSTDFNVGAFARVTFDIPGPLAIDVSYRYSNPPDRDLHSLGIGIAFGL